jgi:hypothetical protein
LPSVTRGEIEVHLYQSGLCALHYYKMTMGKYMNHSREPNVDFSEVSSSWDIRDIHPCEEMTCDYRHFMVDVSQITYLLS